MKPCGLPLIVLGLAATLLPGCGRDETKPVPPSMPAAAVRVLTLEAKSQVGTEEVVGTIRSRLQARIEAKVSGRIEQIRAVPGQRIKAGEVLIRLDAQEIRARLDQALAVRQQTEGDLRRYTALLESAAAARAEFDAIQARARVAEASVKEAQTLLGYTDVTAPFDGVVTRKHADVGDLAAPGKTLLEVEDPAALRVEADVGEALIDRIKPGQTLGVRTPTVAAPLQGTVAEIAPAADPASRTFVVKLDLPPTAGLRAGTFARVAVPTEERAALRVPSEAVLQRGQLEYVFIAVEGRAQLRLVKTGKRHGDEIELLSGATPGEKLVTSGGARLQDGQPLRVQP